MSKIHLFDTTTPASKSHRGWVPHTKTLCGKEVHLNSDFLTNKQYKKEFDSITCKKCIKRLVRNGK